MDFKKKEMAKISFVRPLQNARRLHGLFKNRVLIFQMIRDMIRGKYKPSLINFLIFIVGFAYILFPLDVMPDFIPVLGWIDDGAIIFFLAKRLLNEAEKYLRWKAANQVNYAIPLN